MQTGSSDLEKTTMGSNGGSVAMDSGFCQKRSAQTGSTGTLIGWADITVRDGS
jgi:hypothetical protein